MQEAQRTEHGSTGFVTDGSPPVPEIGRNDVQVDVSTGVVIPDSKY